MKMYLIILMGILTVVSAARATQLTYTWVGFDQDDPHDWATADNWSEVRVTRSPTDIMQLTQKDGSCIVGSSTNETVGSLTVQGMTLTVSGKLEVFNTYGTLALDLDSNDTIGQSVLNITGSEPGTTLAAIAGGANSGIMRLHTLINEEQTTPRTTVNHSSGEVEADRLEMDWSNYNLSGGILRTGEVVFFHERHDPEFKGLFHQTGGEHDCGNAGLMGVAAIASKACTFLKVS